MNKICLLLLCCLLGCSPQKSERETWVNQNVHIRSNGQFFAIQIGVNPPDGPVFSTEQEARARIDSMPLDFLKDRAKVASSETEKSWDIWLP